MSFARVLLDHDKSMTLIKLLEMLRFIVMTSFHYFVNK